MISTGSETGATIDVVNAYGIFFPTLYGCFDSLRLVFDAVDPATVTESDFIVRGSVPLSVLWSDSRPDEITLTVNPYLLPPIPVVEIVGSILTPGGQTSRLLDIKPLGPC